MSNFWVESTVRKSIVAPLEKSFLLFSHNVRSCPDQPGQLRMHLAVETIGFESIQHKVKFLFNRHGAATLHAILLVRKGQSNIYVWRYDEDLGFTSTTLPLWDYLYEVVVPWFEAKVTELSPSPEELKKKEVAYMNAVLEWCATQIPSGVGEG